MSRRDDQDKGKSISNTEIRELLSNEEKRKRLASALSRAMWEEEKALLESERRRGMKD